MGGWLHWLGGIAALTLSVAVSADALAQTPAPPRPDCQAEGDAKPICGFLGPEDFGVLPGDQALLVTEFRMGGKPGPLSLLVLNNNSRRILYEGGSGEAPSPGWGDPACPGAPSRGFSPHGLSLRQRADGVWVLAVVQHGGGRESIEFFEVSGAGGDWRVAWRGCVLAMPHGVFNDVALFADGGFVVSHTGAPERPSAAYSWTRRDGYSELPTTRGGYINGVLLTPGDRRLVINDNAQNETRLFDLATGGLVAKVQVSSPDNAAWAPDGRLLVASFDMAGGPSFPQCFAASSGSCAKPYRIISYAADLTDGRVIHAGGSALMGAASIGAIVGGDLFVGSAGGDRLLRVRLPPSQSTGP